MWEDRCSPLRQGPPFGRWARHRGAIVISQFPDNSRHPPASRRGGLPGPLSKTARHGRPHGLPVSVTRIPRGPGPTDGPPAARREAWVQMPRDSPARSPAVPWAALSKRRRARAPGSQRCVRQGIRQGIALRQGHAWGRQWGWGGGGVTKAERGCRSVLAGVGTCSPSEEGLPHTHRGGGGCPSIVLGVKSGFRKTAGHYLHRARTA